MLSSICPHFLSCPRFIMSILPTLFSSVCCYRVLKEIRHSLHTTQQHINALARNINYARAQHIFSSTYALCRSASGALPPGAPSAIRPPSAGTPACRPHCRPIASRLSCCWLDAVRRNRSVRLGVRGKNTHAREFKNCCWHKWACENAMQARRRGHTCWVPPGNVGRCRR